MRQRLLHTFLEYRKVTTDTRQLDSQAIFFALKGDRFNGNGFAQAALDAGCPLVVVDEETGITDVRIVRVENTLKALQTLALDYRRTFSIPILAITGSNGKTTTKELLRGVLALRYKVHATKGNLNNHIGVALTLLSMPADTTFAVIEMGANHQREIISYCEFTEPEFGLITNIGKAHLEGFGGIEGVKKGKRELYDFVYANGGQIFVNSELDALREITEGRRVIAYGLHTGGQELNVLLGSELLAFSCQIHDGFVAERVETQLVGEYNIWNVASALAVGRHFGIAPNDILGVITSYVPENNRSQVAQTERNRVIMDAYNANPTSVEHALLALAKQKDHKPYFILGDMLELGDESEIEHRRIVELSESLGLDGIFVGPIFSGWSTRAKEKFFETVDAARQYLSSSELSGHLILLKGSRGLRMEQLSDLL